MRFLKPVNVLAAANMLSLAYSVTGMIAFIHFLTKGPNRVALPIGLWLPEVHLTWNLIVFRSENHLYTFWTIVLAMTSGLVSGWITGALCALVYNPLAKALGRQESDPSRPAGTEPSLG